ncbi:hypothetical protein EYF80_015487 [Liparis tanakae]|uniref:Uncharacterized protein n=1 Tax=Liparis tanakae TaxID=230148 RepID=A0A4Z2IAA9_9TELE|nr:hypothetical protein EYF80_015487 [Liparis tanakae]
MATPRKQRPFEAPDKYINGSIIGPLCCGSSERAVLRFAVTETEAVSLKRSSVGGNNGLRQPINVSCSASAH